MEHSVSASCIDPCSIIISRDNLMDYMVASLPAFSAEDISRILDHWDYLVLNASSKGIHDKVFIDYLRANPIQALKNNGSPYSVIVLRDVMRTRLEYMNAISNTGIEPIKKEDLVRYISQRLPGYNIEIIKATLATWNKIVDETRKNKKQIIGNPVELLIRKKVPFNRGVLEDIMSQQSNYVKNKGH